MASETWTPFSWRFAEPQVVTICGKGTRNFPKMDEKSTIFGLTNVKDRQVLFALPWIRTLHEKRRGDIY
jgi:hypothetical protein